MIYDCFLFFNELELLELRLMELDHKVDMFVLCESTHTFKGVPKPLHFQENKARFVKWLPKIRWLIHDGGRHSNPWKNEWEQRDFLEEGVADAKDDDVVMLSDVDEIPHPDSIPEKPGEVSVFKQRLYYYYVNCFQVQPWPGTLVGSVRNLRPFHYTRRTLFWPHVPEGAEKVPKFQGPMLKPGGWHFSFLGGAEKIKQKMAAYSEDNEVADEHIQHCLETGDDLFDRRGPEVEKYFVDINDSFPRQLRRWLKKYPHMAKYVVKA
jgi:beta-1,4-mannosyl-glycoprotein beta-1,4-N-acetylglucosaminyltransferase